MTRQQWQKRANSYGCCQWSAASRIGPLSLLYRNHSCCNKCPRMKSNKSPLSQVIGSCNYYSCFWKTHKEESSFTWYWGEGQILIAGAEWIPWQLDKRWEEAYLLWVEQSLGSLNMQISTWATHWLHDWDKSCHESKTNIYFLGLRMINLVLINWKVAMLVIILERYTLW